MAKTNIRYDGPYCAFCGNEKTAKSAYCSVRCRKSVYRQKRKAIKYKWACILLFSQSTRELVASPLPRKEVRNVVS